MAEKTYKIVTVKHPNNNTPYTFRVPANMELTPGDYVLCSTRSHKVPQVARCITPSFMILGIQLKEFYGISPEVLMPVVGILKPKMYAYESECDDDG